MNGRDDFFTLIHKGIRRRLFDVTMLAATTDWADPAGIAEFTAEWNDLLHLLEIHAEHEDRFFFPLLADADPHLFATMEAAHVEQERALAALTATVARAATQQDPAAGVDVHRELSAFVAGYLRHLLDEERNVMPSIWQHHSDERLAEVRHTFLTAMSPEEADLSRRVMLPSLSPSELALFAAVRGS